MPDPNDFSLRKLVPYPGNLETQRILWDRFLAYMRLIRLPNVFTAPADVFAGYWLYVGLAAPRLTLTLIVAAIGSCLLYITAVIWNDVFDQDVDRNERPDRPIPSGAVPIPFAMFLAAAFLATGVAAVAAAGPIAATAAWMLALLILLYNWKLKSTAAGPVALGACRALNVQLGMAVGLAAVEVPAAGYAAWVPPLANGIYIVGVSLLAKNEVIGADRRTLILALAALAVGVLLHPVVWVVAEAPYSGTAIGMLLVFAGGYLYRLIETWNDPTPSVVQTAVKHGILGLIVVDATIATAFVGPITGVALLLLLIPAIYIGRWVYST